MTHFLQSEAWELFQTSLGRKVISREGDNWSYRAYLESGTLNTRLYTPYGPAFLTQDALDKALVSLINESKKRSVTFVRIEPTEKVSHEIIAKFHMKPVTYQHLQPEHTRVVDLSQSKEDLLAQMSQNTRNITRNYQKKGVTIHTSHDPKDISILLNLLRGVSSRTGMRAHSDSYLTKQATTLLPSKKAVFYYATYENKPIAAALFFDDSTTRYYAHAAASDEYRKFQAGTALLGQAILDAKADNKQTFDLYGIAPPNSPTHPWAGFSRFKQSFGGSPISYGGAWDIPLKPLRYRFYRLYQSVYRLTRK